MGGLDGEAAGQIHQNDGRKADVQWQTRRHQQKEAFEWAG
jgi:hypothetical protein